MRSALWYQKSKMYHKYFEQHEHEIVGMQLAWISEIFTWANSYWSGMLGTHLKTNFTGSAGRNRVLVYSEYTSFVSRGHHKSNRWL